MEEIRRCKVLDIREYSNSTYIYVYHIILKDLIYNKRYNLEIKNICGNVEAYLDYRMFTKCFRHEILIKNDIINVHINNNEIKFEILDESEA